MDDEVTLRPVAEADLAILERLTQDPAATGEFAWLGWHKLGKYRQSWADNRLISDDNGTLMVGSNDPPTLWGWAPHQAPHQPSALTPVPSPPDGLS